MPQDTHSNVSAGECSSGYLLGQAKVSELNLIFCGQKYILRFKIAVKNLFGRGRGLGWFGWGGRHVGVLSPRIGKVTVMESEKDLYEIVPDLIFWKGAAARIIFQYEEQELWENPDREMHFCRRALLMIAPRSPPPQYYYMSSSFDAETFRKRAHASIRI